MAEPRLLIIGQANLELEMRMSRFPSPGENLVSDGVFSFSCGGRGGRAALCAARLGTDTLLCARVGSDLHGRVLKNYYESAGVDTRFLKQDKRRPTPLMQTICEEGGKTRTLLFPGAGEAMRDDDLEDAFSAFPDGVLLHFDTNEQLFRRACDLAAESGIPVFADGVRAAFEYPRAMPKLEAIVLGEAETYAYTDIYPDCLDNYVRACIRLNAKIRSHYFLIRLKGRGTYITDGKYSEILSLPDAAGEMADRPDVFAAALSCELLRGTSITEAAKTAGALCAYLSLNRSAPTPYPTREELALFCRRSGIR